MGAFTLSSSQQSTGSEKGLCEPSEVGEWEPGPDLKPPGWLKCRSSIIKHTLQFHCIQIAVMLLAIVILLDLALKWDVLRPPVHQNIISVLLSPINLQNAAPLQSESPTNWVDWWIRIQSLLGFGTLLVATFVWYGEIHKEWMNALPKRMSVFFIHKRRPAIVCRHIWLAGEGDLRAWGQQVAAQAACVRFLNFYPNLKAQAPGLAVEPDGKICRHYVVCFELTDDNSFLAEDPVKCFYQNMAAGSNTVFSVPLEELQKAVSPSVFPFEWPEGASVPTQTALSMHPPK